MRGKRYPQEQIIAILKEAEAGIPVGELCRKHGISDNTIYTGERDGSSQHYLLIDNGL